VPLLLERRDGARSDLDGGDDGRSVGDTRDDRGTAEDGNRRSL
jgi:hypothetical protein